MAQRRVAPLALLLLFAAVACGGSGDTASQRVDAGPDPLRVGPQGNLAQFVVECDLSHYAFDDPIVHPFDEGRSHLHQFFGNRDVGSAPDYEALLGADSSCEQPKDTASYWAPALLAADGNRVEALGMTAYYRPGNGVAPAEVVAYPPGL